MRLGELLIAMGALSDDDLEVARARQEETGARLGTTLIELGFLAVDDLARALARQHGVPAALTRHLQERDRGLAARLPAEIARDLRALPVALSRGAEGVNLVVCFRDPDPDIIAAVSAAVGLPVIPAVAGERVLEIELRGTYPEAFAPRPAAEMAAVTPEPEDDDSFDVDLEDDDHGFGALAQLSLVDLDDKRVSRDHSQTLMLPSQRDTAQGGRVSPPPRPVTGQSSAAAAMPRTVTNQSAAVAMPRTVTNQSAAVAVPRTTTNQSNPFVAVPRTTTSQSQPAVAVPRTTTARGLAASEAPRPAPTRATDPGPSSARIAAAAPGPSSARTPAVTPPPPPPPPPSGRFSRVSFEQVTRASAAAPVATPPAPSASSSGTMAAVAPEARPRTTVEGAALCTGPRDPVAERVLPHLISSWRIALVLAVEPDRVIARTGVGASLTAAMLESLSVSLAGPSLLQSVIAARRAHVGDALDAGGAPREPWLHGLAEAGARELAIAPVIVGDRVVRIVVAVGARLEIGAASGEVLRVARTMLDGYRTTPP